MTKIATAALALLLCGFSLEARPPKKPSLSGTYVATAYSVTGTTAGGTQTNRHVIAADPDILPIGTKVRIRRAGKYSGEYVVADTGEKIVGRKIDIYMPSTPECKKFGKKPIRLKVLELGNGTSQSAKETDKEVKKDVAHDIKQGTVGRAATEVDWANKKKTETNPAQSSSASPISPTPAVITDATPH